MVEQKAPQDAKSFEELKGKIKKQKGTDTQQIIKQVATRDKLERDYKEDLLNVNFYSSPETKRMIKAKRPAKKAMKEQLKIVT